MRRIAIALITALLPAAASAQNGGFTAGSRDVFVLDLASVPVGEFPKQVKQLKGTMAVVQKDGKPMLKASNESVFLITLPEVLPPDFTVEVALVPKAGGGPPDLSLEGTRTTDQGIASANILWDPDGALAVIGGAADNFETPMPEELGTTLPGVLTQVNVGYTGNTIKLFTNGRRLYTLDRQFARGRVLRVSLGGVDEPNGAVYLAGLRIASNMPARRFWSEDTDFQPAQRTLFDLNAPPPDPDEQPKKPRPGVRVIRGAWTRVQVDGMRMFKVSQATELLVSLLEPLPRDFTVEFELVPKECCPPPDLSFEGTPTIDQGERSAHLLWQADGAVAAIGGSADNYETPMPEDFKVILPGVPTEVAASFQGGTIKLYTNGRRLYTLTGRQFVRGKVLRVFLGGQNATDQAVYLAKLRIATNSPPPPPKP